MVGPPWWILDKVKPAGPSRDMGSWTAISFSHEQQAEFGVDETGEVLDQATFAAALAARRHASLEPASSEPLLEAVLIPEKLYKIVAKGSSQGLQASSRGLLITDDAPCNWRIRHGCPGWFCISTAGESPMCLDLSNPGQEPMLSGKADVSGQYWKLDGVVGCKELEGGAMARCVVGYKLHAQWTGASRVLTAEGEPRLQPDEDLEGQLWEVLDDAGRMWTEPAAEEPRLIECDFGQQEPELIACDFGQPASP